MKLSRSLKLLVTGDADTAKLFDQTLDRSEDAAATSPVIAEENSGHMKVAAGAVGVAIPLGGVASARFVLLATDKDINVRLNGGTESIAVKAGAGARGLFLLEGAVTALVLDNPGATDATVLYALAGV